jgi:MFS family permease
MWWTADSFKAVFWVAVLPAFLALMLILFAVHEPDRPAGLRKVRSPLHHDELVRLSRNYWLVIAAATVFTLARFSEAFLILRAQSVGLAIMWVPAVLVLMNVVYALAAYPAGVLADDGGRHRVLVVGLAMLVAADLILAFAPSLAGAAIGVALWGLHMGFTQGLLATLVADTSPPELRGTAFGVFNLLTGGASLAASVIAGALWDRIGAQSTFVAGALFAGLALIGLLALRRHLSGRAVA